MTIGRFAFRGFFLLNKGTANTVDIFPISSVHNLSIDIQLVIFSFLKNSTGVIFFLLKGIHKGIV